MSKPQATPKPGPNPHPNPTIPALVQELLRAREAGFIQQLVEELELVVEPSVLQELQDAARCAWPVWRQQPSSSAQLLLRSMSVLVTPASIFQVLLGCRVPQGAPGLDMT